MEVGIQGIIRLITEVFYEEVFPVDVIDAYQQVEKIAREAGKVEEFKSELGREIMRHSCMAGLREVLVRRMGEGG